MTGVGEKHFPHSPPLCLHLETRKFRPNPEQPWPLAVGWCVPSGLGRANVTRVMQPLGSCFHESEDPRAGCQRPLPCAQLP